MKLSAESEHGPAPTFSWRRAPDRGEVAPPIAAKSRRKAGAILNPESMLKIAPVHDGAPHDELPAVQKYAGTLADHEVGVGHGWLASALTLTL